VKLSVSYKGGPVTIATQSKLGPSLSATGQTSGDSYRFKGASSTKTLWNSTLGSLDGIVALESDPVPGIDGKLGRNPGGLLATHHVTFESAGQVTSSLARVVRLPTPSTATCTVLQQICN